MKNEIPLSERTTIDLGESKPANKENLSVRGFKTLLTTARYTPDEAIKKRALKVLEKHREEILGTLAEREFDSSACEDQITNIVPFSVERVQEGKGEERSLHRPAGWYWRKAVNDSPYETLPQVVQDLLDEFDSMFYSLIEFRIPAYDMVAKQWWKYRRGLPRADELRKLALELIKDIEALQEIICRAGGGPGLVREAVEMLKYVSPSKELDQFKHHSATFIAHGINMWIH